MFLVDNAEDVLKGRAVLGTRVCVKEEATLGSISATSGREPRILGGIIDFEVGMQAKTAPWLTFFDYGKGCAPN